MFSCIAGFSLTLNGTLDNKIITIVVQNNCVNCRFEISISKTVLDAIQVMTTCLLGVTNNGLV